MGCVKEMRQVVDQVIDPGCVFERRLQDDKSFDIRKGDHFSFPTNLKKLGIRMGWAGKANTGFAADPELACILLKDADGDGILDPIYGSDMTSSVRGIYFKSIFSIDLDADGDKWIIDIELDAIPPDVSVIAVVASIPNNSSTFDKVNGCYVRLIDTSTQWQYAKYQLGDKKKYVNKKQGVVLCFIEKGKLVSDPAWSVIIIEEEVDGSYSFEMTSPLWEGTLITNQYSKYCCCSLS
jgi:hypothetical protein